MTLHSLQDKLAGPIYVSSADFGKNWSPAKKLWMRPVRIGPLKELLTSLTANSILPLAGGPYGFSHFDLVTGNWPGKYKAARVSIDEAHQIIGNGCESQLEAITSLRPNFAGLPGWVQVMGCKCHAG